MISFLRLAGMDVDVDVDVVCNGISSCALSGGAEARLSVVR